MKYDFTSVPDRTGTGATKWDDSNGASTEYVPLSVADMEFYTAPKIAKALSDLSLNTILGYTSPTEEYFNAVVGWMKRRHDWEVKKEWIFSTPGVISALSMLIEAVTKPADGIILLTPVYYPFDMVTIARSRHIVYNKLINNGGRFEIDYADLEEKAKNPKNTAILFCNPHNPVGRVWTREELQKVGDICTDNGVFIIDDEIHNDLIMPGVKHTVFATVSEKIKNNIAVCTAPSKTFNLAGLQCSNIFVPNEKWRARAFATSMLNMNMHLNIFAYTACRVAYDECEDWLDELLTVIDGNAKYVEKYMADNFPEVYVHRLEGTYLQWLDCRKLGFTHVELKNAFEKHKLFLDYGEMFGDAGRGYERINLACAQTTLEKAMAHFKDAIDELRENVAKNGAPYHKTLTAGDKLENFVYHKDGKKINLADTIKKPTLIAFLRYASCDITKAVLDKISKAYLGIKFLGADVKAVIQSSADEIENERLDTQFELISDENAELYDKYNVFEANSAFNFVAGDKTFEDMVGGNIMNLFGTDTFDNFFGGVVGTGEQHPERRNLQLCAFIVVDTDMTVRYARYSKTVGDFPDVQELVNALKK